MDKHLVANIVLLGVAGFVGLLIMVTEIICTHARVKEQIARDERRAQEAAERMLQKKVTLK